MSFSKYVQNKNLKFNVEIVKNDFRENLLADLSNIILNESEKTKEYISEAFDYKFLNEFCQTYKYSKNESLQISIKSKNLEKIMNLVDDLQNYVERKNKPDANKQFDKIKNIIFEYIIKVKNEHLTSQDIDLILENRLQELDNILHEITKNIINAFDTSHDQFFINPIYDCLEQSLNLVKVTINKNQDASFDCFVKNKNLQFENLVIVSQNEKFRNRINESFEKLNNKFQSKTISTLYFEWPKEKTAELLEAKKNLSWGLPLDLPKNIKIQGNIPENTENEIWKIKIKRFDRSLINESNSLEKVEDCIVWIERMTNG